MINKGQVTIPINIPKKLGITPDTEIKFLQVRRSGFSGKTERGCPATRKFNKLRGVATVKITTGEIMNSGDIIPN